MKYLANLKTKEHKILTDNMIWSGNDWRIVDADDKGWIKWKDGECPLPLKAKVDLRWKFGGDNYKTQAKGWNWEGSGPNRILSYRPIFKSSKKPVVKDCLTTPMTIKETWDEINARSQVDVFASLSAAVAASESIPALIAEINSMLPEGYEVTCK